MILFFYYPAFGYLLYIFRFDNGSIGCDIFPLYSPSITNTLCN